MQQQLRLGVATLSSAIMVVAGMAVATPAYADANGFTLTKSVYGPDEPIAIQAGTLTRDCDVFWTTSDVYVVPNGSVGDGDALADVSGAPTTLEATDTSDEVSGEVIGNTSPGGSLGPGDYDVIEDTCQDGVYTAGEDSLLSNAFSVNIPADVPALPATQIQQVKAGATAQANFFAGSVKSYDAVFAATTAYSHLADASSSLGFYLTYACSFLPEMAGSTAMPWCPSVSPRDPVHLQSDVTQNLLDRASLYDDIAATSPDPNFSDPSLAGARERFTPASDRPLWHAMAQWTEVGSEINELSAAFLGALEKYQGAAQAGDTAAALMHAYSIQSLARLLSTVIGSEAGTVSAITSGASNSGINLATGLNRLRLTLTSLEANGISADDERELRNLGATPGQIDAFTADLLDHLGSADVPASFNRLYDSTVSVNNQMTAAYTDLGNSMSTIITELESAVQSQSLTAYPRITSISLPSSIQVNSSRSLSATCATCTTIEWDLDSDGSFDDATGTSISPTFTQPGRVLVGVRGTNADGFQVAAYARTNVTTPNRPPSHGTPVPTAESLVEVPVGGSQTFTVTPTDPDGNSLTTEWLLGGDIVGSGDSHTLTAPAAPLRAHGLFAHTTDGAGRAAATRWTVIPVHPDSDGDGWRSNVDCNDNDPNVSPGQSEIAGNGIDDDCNPATPDIGAPTARFTIDPLVGIVGEPVAFTSESTDVEGPIASHAWDFDGDDTVDATTESADHTFTAPGTYDVTLVVTDSDGIGGTETSTLIVTERPVASFSFSPGLATVGNSVTFTDTSTDSDGIASWEWDFDYDGVTFNAESTDQHPVHAFSSSPTVALRVTDSLGATSEITTQVVPVTGPPMAAFSPLPDTGLGDVARLEHGGQAVLWSSQASSNSAAVEMIDTDYPSSEAGWSTGNGLVTNQWAIFDLGRVWQIEALAVQPAGTGSQRPQNVEFGLSNLGALPGTFSPVAALELANSSALQQIDLATPWSGRWVRYEALDNRGNTSQIRTDRFQALTGQAGGSTVAFTDRSTDADEDIVSWLWNFGDGSPTVTEQNPTHTFAAPGDYTVTLTVTDGNGDTSTRSLMQRVVEELPAPTFTFPDTINEASGARFTDTTPDALTDRAIVERTWTWGDGGTTSHTVAPSKSFPDNGEYDVTLTLVDSWGMTSATTQTVTVHNRPPTGSAGSDFRSYVSELSPGVVGAVWTSNATASDPSTADRPALQCAWDFGDGSDTVTIQPCSNTTVRVPHTYTVGEYTATLTITDKDGGELVDTADIVVEKSPTYLSVYPIPGSSDGGNVSVRAKLWNSDGFKTIAGVDLTITLDGESQTVTTDAAGEAVVNLPLGADRELSAIFAGNANYLGSTDDTLVPSIQRPPGDVIFTIDESGSMDTVQAQVGQNIVTIANQLATQLDYQIGIMGYGGGFPAVDGRPGYLPRIVVPATDNLDDVADAVAALTTGGGTEPGINAIIDALHPDVGLRPGAGACVVFVGDEATQQYQTTPAAAAQALADSGAILFSIITVAANTTAYQELAVNSGGAFFSISDFASDPGPVLDALLDSCATALVQRPDLVVDIDDNRTEVTAGETLTYTVTTDNVGPIAATGVDLTVDLPTGVTFVSASDGGTFDAGTVSWPAFGVDGQGTAERTITVTVAAGVSAGDTLSATARAFDDGANGNDLTPANNVNTDTTVVGSPGTLTVITQVTNDDGGTATPGDFTVGVSGSTGPIASGPGSASGTSHTVPVGGYTVNPGAQAGYTTTITGDCAIDGTVTITAGQSATCTIVHNDNPVPDESGTLTVITQVTNDDGGTATPGDVTVSIADSSDVVASGPGSAAGNVQTLEVGDYLVSAIVPSGYVAVISGDCDINGSVDVGLDGDHTCVVTLDDVPGSLSVAFTASDVDASEFTLTINGIEVAFGDRVTLPAGTHAVAVSGPSTHTLAISGACAVDGSVSLGLDQHLDCEVTATSTTEPVPTEPDPSDEPEQPSDEPSDEPATGPGSAAQLPATGAPEVLALLMVSALLLLFGTMLAIHGRRRSQ